MMERRSPLLRANRVVAKSLALRNANSGFTTARRRYGRLVPSAVRVDLMSPRWDAFWLQIGHSCRTACKEMLPEIARSRQKSVRSPDRRRSRPLSMPDQEIHGPAPPLPLIRIRGYDERA